MEAVFDVKVLQKLDNMLYLAHAYKAKEAKRNLEDRPS